MRWNLRIIPNRFSQHICFLFFQFCQIITSKISLNIKISQLKTFFTFHFDMAPVDDYLSGHWLKTWWSFKEFHYFHCHEISTWKKNSVMLPQTCRKNKCKAKLCLFSTTRAKCDFHVKLKGVRHLSKKWMKESKKIKILKPFGSFQGMENLYYKFCKYKII